MMNERDLVLTRFEHDDRRFHNLAPVTREARHASKDKESREKALLEQRPAQYGQKYINYGRHLTASIPDTVAYISEQDRFYTDFAEEEKKRRDQALETKEEMIARRRLQNVRLEEERWSKIDADYQSDVTKQMRLMDRGAPRNESSVPYNPLTLQYRETKAGEQLRYMDDTTRYRAAVRAENLRIQQTREGFNPITGQAYDSIHLPPKPTPPYQ